MVMQISASFLAIIFLYSCHNARRNSIKEETNQVNGIKSNTDTTYQKNSDFSLITNYDYDTLLRGGYKLLFKNDNSKESLYLQKGRIIKRIASCSKGLPYKNLGYKVADFDNYFVLAHSFGAGNPNYIELIRKKTGESILEKDAAWIGASETMESIVYYTTNVSEQENKMILYNVKTRQKEYYNFPRDVIYEPLLISQVHIKSITNKYMIIEYENKGVLCQRIFVRPKYKH